MGSAICEGEVKMRRFKLGPSFEKDGRINIQINRTFYGKLLANIFKYKTTVKWNLISRWCKITNKSFEEYVERYH